MTTTMMAVGGSVVVNGKTFSVARVGANTVGLVGGRGGKFWLVRNEKSGRWSLVGGGSWRSPKSVAVETCEVV